VTAVDLNAGMIDVARNVPALHGATIEWRIANATALPLEDGSADAVLCAQTLQFLPNKKSALLEMRRVLAPAGRIGVSLWTAIDDNPYFAALVGALTRHLGADTAAGLRSAFALTAADDIRTLLTAAGFVPVNLFETQLSLPLPDSIRFVPRHLSATPMAADYGAASTAQQAAIAQDVAGEMKRYVTDGRLSVPFTSHLIVCRT
jgi:SAM-dependent methyltransferase